MNSDRLHHLHERHQVRWGKYGFKNLLVWFFVYLVVGPFLEPSQSAETIMSGFLTLVLISALGAMSGSRGQIAIGCAVLAISLVLLWLRTWSLIDTQINLPAFGLAGFLTFIVYSFSRHLYLVRKVTSNVICAALCLYLVIGLMWGAMFAVLESLVPGSFAGGLLEQAETPHQLMHHLQYFSYVTLSTLGYGDITPQTRGAAALCQTEAILGQFLTVVLVARLVGIQVAQQANQEE